MTLTAAELDVKEARPQRLRAPVPELAPTRRHHRFVLPALVVGVAASCVLSLQLGPFWVSAPDTARIVWAGLIGSEPAGGVPATAHTIVWQLRVPRVVTGALVGAVLAASGAALQAVVRNMLADPFLLGVSSGASLGAAAVITLGLGSLVGAITLSAGAFLGALLALTLVLALVHRPGRFSSTRLVLAGITVSYFLGAITNLIVVF
ncbi:MAG: iron chelate uptake ABC transporter family permease subunit, partial [Nocardioides sp.]